MVDTNQLRGIIASRGYSQSNVAKHLGITEKTFYQKMKKGVFGTDEAQAMVELLNIEDPSSVFFANEVTCGVTVRKEA